MGHEKFNSLHGSEISFGDEDNLSNKISAYGRKVDWTKHNLKKNELKLKICRDIYN